MARQSAAPGADDKIGKKIDHIAKRLGAALAPRGFACQARTLYGQQGQGVQRCWQIVNLQGNKWNAGSTGSFYVNVALQFPAIHELLGRMPGQEWRLAGADRPEEAAGQLRERVENLLPAGFAQRWPALASLAKDGRVQIDRGTDLDGLAAELSEALQSAALPWMQERSRLDCLYGPEANHAGGLACADALTRVAAAALLEDREAGNRLVAARPEGLTRFVGDKRAQLCQWLSSLGLDDTPLREAPPPEPLVDRYFARKAEQERAAGAAKAAEAAAFQAAEGDWQRRLPEFAGAWRAEHESRWRQEPHPLQDLALGRWLAAQTDAVRLQVVLELLRPLAARTGTTADVDVDSTVSALCAPLLPTLASASEDDGRAVFAVMEPLVDRFDAGLVTVGYAWPFKPLVAWLDEVGVPHRAALKPAVQRWLDVWSEAMLRRHEEQSRQIDEWLNKPLDPSDPLYDVRQRSREEMLARQAAHPIDPADVRRRLREYPEQSLNAADREAVKRLRRWLLRDPATDKVPFAFDADDWGRQTRAAVDALPSGRREALMPLLDWLAEGVASKPTQRWFKQLDQHRAALAPAGPWAGWLCDRLAEFEHTEGRTEWATTGARPGVGARLGEASEAVLLGWMWWAQREHAAGAGAAYEDALQRVAQAAWAQLPEIGARAAGVGTLALQLLAASESGREWVRRFGAGSKKKQLKRAVDQALAAG